MSSIDERIVQMKFDNAQFENGIKQSTKSLDDLKQGLNLDGATQSLKGLSVEAGKFSLAGIASGVDTIASKFTTLGVMGVTALANITNAAINTGVQLAKSIVIDPIKSGFQEYEMNLNAIQTILASTKRQGQSLETVNTALDTLNAYSDKTIYNFGQMVQGVKTLTTTGANLQTSVDVVKGFANAAALAGVGANEMASALQYGLNQAISKGRMMTQDWMSLETSGIASDSFKKSIMETARVNGVAVDDIIAKNGSFRESLSEGWLTAEILQQTLAKYTGEMSDEQLRQIGYTDEQIAGIQELARTAMASAQDIKTVSQLISVLQESTGSGWAQTWRILFGDLEEAKTLFTNVNNVIGGMISASSEARNQLLSDWKALGGRAVLIDAISNAFNGLMSIIKPIKQAFQEIFPPATGKQLYDITVAIRDFTSKLILGYKESTNLKNTFKGLFAILDIGWMVIQQVVGLFGKLFGASAAVGGGILSITGGIGELLVKFRDAIKNGDLLAKVFTFIGDVLTYPIDMLKQMGQAISQGTSNSEGFQNFWVAFGEAFKNIWNFIKPAVDWLIDGLKNLAKGIRDFFATFNFNSLLGMAGVGIGGTFVYFVVNFIKMITDIFGGLQLGLVSNLKGVFNALQTSLQDMQKSIQAKTIMNIAIAIGVLAAAVLILSFVDPVKLAAALGAITVMLGQLMATLYVFNKIASDKGIIGITLISASLVSLAIALVILSTAILIIASLDWNELARGLTGMAVGLALMIATVKLLSGGEIAKMWTVAGALTFMSLAIMVLAGALKIMSTISWDELLRGIAAMAGALGVLIAAMKILSASDVLKLVVFAGAINGFSFAMLTLSGALKAFSLLSLEDIGRALLALAGSMAILVVTMKLMGSPLTLLGAMGVISVSAAMVVLAGALKAFSTLSWDEILRGLVGMGGAMLILAGGMALMGLGPVLAGSIGLLVAAGALMVLAPALKILGSMSWDEIGRGLAILASAIGILAVGGVLLIAAVPAFLLLGVAMVLIGGAMLAAGTGMMLFAAGIGLLAAGAAAGAVAIQLAIMAIASMIPMILTKIGEGIKAFAATIATAGTEFTAMFVTILMSIIDAINTTAPAIITTLTNLLLMLLAAMEVLIPAFVDTGMKIIVGFLRGIADNIQAVVEAGGDIIINFLNGLSDKLPGIIDAAFNLVVAFVDGVATAVENNSSKFVAAGSKLFRGIIDGVSKAIEQGGSDIRWAAERIGSGLLNGVKNFLGIHSPSVEFFKVGGYVINGLVNGIRDDLTSVNAAGESVGDTALSAMQKSIDAAYATVSGGMDLSPTITPVLDLSQVTAQAATLGGLFSTPTLAIDANYASASSILASQNRSETDTTQAATAAGNTVTYNQYNTSPKALSSAEVYRQTKNQLSMLKEELNA